MFLGKSWLRLKWVEVCIHTSHDAMEPISNVLHEIGAGAAGIVIEDPLDLIKDRETFFGEIYELDPEKYPETGIYMKVYVLDDSSLDIKVEEIKQAINQLLIYEIDLGANIITLSHLDEEDWATSWKKYYKPMKVSERITIVPTWETYEPKTSDAIIIELDPGMAFGTGTHPTTILSIRALEQYLVKDDLVIDVGCGSGVLSIASGLLGAQKVFAYDLDAVAVKSTELNVGLNKLSEKVISQENNLLENIDKQVNVIVSNILAEIIVKFVADAWRNLVKDGLFITSGIIQRKKELVIEELEKVGFQIITTTEMDDWVCIVAKKI